MSIERLLLNQPEDAETAVLHLEHGDERCNRDDMKGRQFIDPETADALRTLGDAIDCEICFPKTED